MKAMLINKFAPIDQSPLELTDVPKPEPEAEDIRICIDVCGVCHTDLHTIEGELPDVKLPIKTTTQIFPLEEANKAPQLLKASKIDGAAVLQISK